MILIVVVAASASLLLGTAAPPAQAASWGHCDFLDPVDKKLRTFNRAAGSGFAAGKAVLTCGQQGWDDETGMGYRHIRFRHQKDWEKWSFLMGGTWEGVADWCSAQALKAPAYVTYRMKNDTYAYKTQIQIRDLRGTLLYSFYANVVVARTTQNIITAFPSER